MRVVSTRVLPLPAPAKTRADCGGQVNIRRAVFSIWQLKPHSLSYHANTLTILPAVTLVSVESNVLAWVVWLKSIETSGRVL
ncbi:Uncharacterised protein [Mycobacteroides abscessus subsp. massiliense]|nr:Uncharacterised protein [Mycobacteroides abscessus subsp. massiliense]